MSDGSSEYPKDQLAKAREAQEKLRAKAAANPQPQEGAGPVRPANITTKFGKADIKWYTNHIGSAELQASEVIGNKEVVLVMYHPGAGSQLLKPGLNTHGVIDGQCLNALLVLAAELAMLQTDNATLLAAVQETHANYTAVKERLDSAEDRIVAIEGLLAI